MTKEELEIREILKSEMFATNGHAKANNPHFEIIFDMAYKLGFDQQNKALLKKVEELRKGIKTVLENPTTKSEGENVKHIFDEEIKILEQLLNPNT